MASWFELSRYHFAAIFLASGVCAALFTWNSFNLAHLAMENFRFLGQYGRLALSEGGLVQLAEIAVKGYLSLAFYLGFKACEVELVYRWRAARHG
jgi:hypothetical protein